MMMNTKNGKIFHPGEAYRECTAPAQDPPQLAPTLPPSPTFRLDLPTRPPPRVRSGCWPPPQPILHVFDSDGILVEAAELPPPENRWETLPPSQPRFQPRFQSNGRLRHRVRVDHRRLHTEVADYPPSQRLADFVDGRTHPPPQMLELNDKKHRTRIPSFTPAELAC